MRSTTSLRLHQLVVIRHAGAGSLDSLLTSFEIFLRIRRLGETAREALDRGRSEQKTSPQTQGFRSSRQSDSNRGATVYKIRRAFPRSSAPVTADARNALWHGHFLVVIGTIANFPETPTPQFERTLQAALAGGDFAGTG
jgi:hypothetical protein